MPILWDELFGIVMAKAMACGTPVIGLDRGAVPEVVRATLQRILVVEAYLNIYRKFVLPSAAAIKC
jgi:glycosyltransferase involved in cell wall biosynthesis